MSAKLTRITQKPFGTSGPTGDFGAFGSKALNPSSPIFTQNPTTIQSLAEFAQGWGAAIIGNYEPPMEDMNGLFLLIFYQLGYMFQMGIPEWDSGTNYFTNSVCQIAGQLFISKVDNNLNYNPSVSPTQWQSGIPGAEISGAMKVWPITNPPAGYLVCNGQAISRTVYLALFNLLGTTYGAGDGSTTFNLPNLAGQLPIGYVSGDPNFGVVGEQGGSVIITVENLPPHTHSIETYYGGGLFASANGGVQWAR